MGKTVFWLFAAAAAAFGLTVIVNRFGGPEHKEKLRAKLMHLAVEAIFFLLSYAGRITAKHLPDLSGRARDCNLFPAH